MTGNNIHIRGEQFVWHDYSRFSTTALTERNVREAIKKVTKYGFDDDAGYDKIRLKDGKWFCSLCLRKAHPIVKAILLKEREIEISQVGEPKQYIPYIPDT